jgi:ribonuclease HI
MKGRIEFTYKTPKKTEAKFSSDELTAGQALLIIEDLEKTGRMKEVMFIDAMDQSWNVKELRKFLKEIETEPHDVTVYFDGGFDLETKRSGLGCVIYYQQNKKSFRLRKNALVDGLDTNNEAEYAAFHLALQELELLGVHHLPVTFIGDSQVVINQLKEEWPCYEEVLLKWLERIDQKLEQLGINPEYELVSRNKNKEADQLATQALKEIEIMANSEVQPWQ